MVSKLKIADLKVFRCGNFSFIKVYTDEGITGVGENVIMSKTILESQADVLKILLVGENPFQIERVWRKLYSNTSFSHANSMISGVDVALWDIKGKALGIPVYELLGGLYRNKIRLYPHLRGSWNSYPDSKTDNLFSEPCA